MAPRYRYRQGGEFVDAEAYVRVSGSFLPVGSLPPTDPPPRSVMTLRGDPGFDATLLSSAQQTRLSTMKALIKRGTDDSRDPYQNARRDDIWWYSHDLRTNIGAQIIAFRATGDMWFLDTIYELLDIMLYKREVSPGTALRLDTKYRGTCSTSGCATEGFDTGYLMWVHRQNPNNAQRGTDLREDYDYATHALVAQVAYMLHHNRDLVSPEGYSYGARADWLRNYLLTHFEAKLRARWNKPSGFPIRNWPAQFDRYFAWSNWHYYMGLLTGNSAYTAEAQRMNALILNPANLCSYSTATGTAYAFRRNAQFITDGSGDYICPSTYTQFPFMDVLDMYFQGFDVWVDPVHLERFGRAITQRMMDNSNPVSNGLSACMAGGTTPCGWESREGSFTRVSAFIYQNGTWGFLSPWDSSGDIAALNEVMRSHSQTQAASNNTWDRTRLLAAQFLHEHLLST